MSQIIVSITDFRRNAGAYIAKAIPLTIVKDSRVVGNYMPIDGSKILTTGQKIDKLNKLSGGLSLGKDLTAKKMNSDYDKVYDEMLPR